MKNYATYTLADFVGDEDFRDWVQGQSDREEFWHSLIRDYPNKSETIRQAEWIIRSTNVENEGISEAEVKTEVDEFLKRAATGYADNFVPTLKMGSIRPLFKSIKLWAAAAVAMIAIGFGWYSFNSKSAEKHFGIAKTSSMVETVNDSEKALRLVLSDNSVIMLSPKSRLRYPSQFTGNERKVFLTGEAGFSVTHMSKPFMVYTGEMVTKVLGTRFVVKAFDQDGKISVQVQSGKVSVYSTEPSASSNVKERKGVILTANQAAIFEKNDQQLTKTLVASPVVITKDNKVVNFFYDEVPLPVILRELEKGYGIPIQFDAENFERCRITATLSTETLFEKLDLLCKTVSASYEIVDGQIAITGNGCH